MPSHPTASRTTLITTAAVIWALVGMLLIVRAGLYMPDSYHANAAALIMVAAAGVGLGFFKGNWVFVKLARKNVERIRALAPHKEKVCVFAFQAWQSYLVVAVMVTLGILLRMSPLPRIYLIGIYLLIGTGLLLGSRAYLKD